MFMDWMGTYIRSLHPVVTLQSGSRQRKKSDLPNSKDEFANLHVYDFDPNYPPEKWKTIWDQIAEEKYVVIKSNHCRKTCDESLLIQIEIFR